MNTEPRRITKALTVFMILLVASTLFFESIAYGKLSGSIKVGAGASAVQGAAVWTERSTASAPSTRYEFGLAHDPARDVVMLFGGYTGGSLLADTWTWDGSDWTQLFPTTVPPLRARFEMEYDAARNVIMFFGGGYRGNTLDDTWQWENDDWVQLFPAYKPPARIDHRLAYDSARERVVLFGGWNGTTWNSGNCFNDTWEWDGFDWVQRFPVNKPPARAGHTLAYDAARGRVVLFGGWDGSSHFNDTWEWDGVDWTQRFPATIPSARAYHAMNYDKLRGRTVLFGGTEAPPGPDNAPLDDTWEWDGNSWAQNILGLSPPARYVHSLTYDSTRNSILLFGGYGGSYGLNDTWEYSVVQSCVAPPAGLVSWWPGERSAFDIVGTNHGNLQGAVTFTDGVVGQAFRFDGSAGSFVSIPDHPTLDLTNEITLEFWFNRNSIGGWRGLVAKRYQPTGITNYGVNFLEEPYYWGLGLYYNDPTISGYGDDGNIFETARIPTPPADQFHHFAGTYRQIDSNHVELNIFINGQLVKTLTLPGNLENTLNDTPVTIGSTYEMVEPFVGTIDEVTIYNRALSGAEIQAIYEVGSEGKCRDEEPTAIILSYFTAEADAVDVTLTWEIGTEIDNAGFNLYRAPSANGPWTKINGALIAAQGAAVSGASYSFVDSPGFGTFYYKLEDVDYNGVSTMHGPVNVSLAPPLRRPMHRPTLPR